MAPGLIITPSLTFLVNRSNSLISREEFQSFNNDFQKLSQILSSLGTLIPLHFETALHEIGRENQSITNLECIIQDIEDLLDDLEIQVSFVIKRFLFRWRIKKLLLKLDMILTNIRLSITSGSWIPQTSFKAVPEETNEILTVPIISGRERETEDIIQVLLSNNEYHLSIFPVFGVAGVGKTAVAQFVYGDRRIEDNFDARIWVSTVEDFSIEKITQLMIESLGQRSCEHLELDLMQTIFKSLVCATKFLFVLDDVWDDDMQGWEGIIDAVASGGKGSSIIVTTRLLTVVDNIAKLSNLCVINPTYNLLPLRDNDAWDILRSYELEVKDERMIATGKDIVAKCKGSPLLLKEAATLVRSRGYSFWESDGARQIVNAELLREFDVKPSLKRRYCNLPPIYMQCLAYCFMFPKGYEIEVEEVIRLWIANGLVDTEDYAEEIFKELVLKSFFPKPEENWLGIKILKLREYVHNLVRLVARTQCRALENGDQLATIPETVRHLLVSDGPQSRRMVNIISNMHLPLQTCIFPPIDCSLLLLIFEKLTSLRAFHLRGSNIQNLPMSIANLKHLRYLNLSSSVHLQLLPESICNLRFLQMLELSQCWKLQRLPTSISKLINLRSLYLNDCRSLIQLPDGIGRLTNLRHLDLSECDSLIQIPDAIGQLRNLRHLDLHDCKSLSQLPHVIGQLTNLIYLDISRCLDLKGLPDEIGELVSLRRLNLSKLLELTHLPLLELVLGSDSGLSIKVLHGLNNLEGELQIRGLGHVKGGAEVKEANLVAKENLSSLSLVWEDLLVDRRDNSYEVIECLRPPRNLKKLVIGQYRGSLFPTWVKLLMKVIEIQLFGCSECEDLPPLGQLPLLRKLCISGMHSLKRINKEFYGITSSCDTGGTSDGEEFIAPPEELEFTGFHRLEEWHSWDEGKLVDDEKEAGGTSQGKGFFPSLEELEFKELQNWEEWQVIDDEKVFLRLQKLRLDNCPNIASLPLTIQHSVQKFEITRCEKLMVI